MTNLTATPWMAVLSKIVRSSNDDTTRTLAKMLYDIFDSSSDPVIGQIADAYAYTLLGSVTK